MAACATHFAKYLMKTTATTQLSGEDAKTCECADAHRATWGGRSMQFFDVPGSGTVWDELRRVRDPAVCLAAMRADVQTLHAAACGNDYARFLAVFAPMRADKRISIVYGQRRASTYLRGLAIDDVLIDTHPVEWALSHRVAPASRELAVGGRTLRHSYPSKAKDNAPAGDSVTPIRPPRNGGRESNIDGARRASSMRRGSEGMQSPRLTTFARKCSEYPSPAKGAVADGRD